MEEDRLYIREWREAAGISQHELARRLGISPPAVANWETLKANPTADKLPALKRALGCSVDDLYRPAQVSA